ncbi:MAG: glycosyltransferase family 39 protein [Thermodesulfovibrionales bacterium]
MKKPKQKEILILFFCLFIGFALRFYTFDQKSLWMDEVYTFNDSRDDLRAQLKFYKENPTFLHPPFFFILTHQFYPFTKPERDLRIIPLIFGTLSLPMIYLLAKSFSPSIALPCTLSLTFMTYHISLSQDGRSYSLLMFIGMVGLYLFMKHLKTSKKRYLILVSFFFSILFYTSYSSIPFIALSQILWFYRPSEEDKKPVLSSFLTLNGLIFLFCLPWIILVISNYKGQPIGEELRYTKDTISIWSSVYGILHDWVPYAPLMITSVILLILFLFLSKNRKNAIVLLSVFVLPIGGLYLFCKLFNISHFITSRYFISFLPLFLISIYLSLHTIEIKYETLKRFLRLRLLFVILFVASNLIILPLYYSSEKQDFRGLVTYLKGELQDGDNIILSTVAHFPGILHYFGVYPDGRHYIIPHRRISEDEIEFRISLIIENKTFIISCSKKYWLQYALGGRRLWFVVNKITAKKEKDNSPCVLKGYFDGCFLNFNKFPTDDSMYLFLWDPKSPDEKGIDLPIE